jgi:hypothetical protein
MPTPATTIAPQVRAGSLWPMKTREMRAVNRGPSAMVTSTLATVVSVSATMKAVNITLQHTPESQKYGLFQCMSRNTVRPCHSGKITSSDTMVKKLRQKVTSKLLACSSWRVTTPAMDHIRVTATISHTACPCRSFMRRGWRACARAP